MTTRRLLSNVMLSLMTLGLCLALIEVVARVVVWRRAQRPFTTRGSLARFDPRLGWSKPPGASAWLHRPEYDVRLEVNAHGLRGPDRDHKRPEGTQRVLLLGDSFTEGYTVAEVDTVRARLEAALGEAGCGNWEVINGGTLGYSTDQELLFYREQGRSYQPDVVVLLFFYNDLAENVSTDPSKPWFELEAGELVVRNQPVPPPADGNGDRRPEPRTWTTPPWRGSMALRLLSDRTQAGNPDLHRRLAGLGLVEPIESEEMPEAFAPAAPGRRKDVDAMWTRTAALVRALGEDVAADGARLLLFYIPEHSEVNEQVLGLTRRRYGLGRRWDFARVREAFLHMGDELNLPTSSPDAALRAAESAGERAYFPEDGHWAEPGHRIAAQEILARMRTEGWAMCSG